MLASTRHLLAPARHAAAAGRLLAGGRWQQGLAQLRGHPWPTRTEATDAAQQAETIPVFTSFNIYKSKGALNVKPVRAKWGYTEGGAPKLEREGCFMFELANAQGPRQYDWNNKISVALSALELAEVVTDPDKDEGHTFYHDTFKGQSGKEGTMVKNFKWTKDQQSGKAYYINLYVTDKTSGTEKKTNATVSVSLAEFAILKQLALYCMPAMYGFDLAMGNSM